MNVRRVLSCLQFINMTLLHVGDCTFGVPSYVCQASAEGFTFLAACICIPPLICFQTACIAGDC